MQTSSLAAAIAKPAVLTRPSVKHGHANSATKSRRGGRGGILERELLSHEWKI